jgi:hypothetical protein
MSATRIIAGFVLVVALCGCGGGGGGGPEQSDPGLLAGDAQTKALAQLPSVAPLRASPGDIAAGGELLTRLSVVLKLDATVDDVNAAARAVGATAFALARPNSPFITMVVPRQADARALDTLAAQLRGRAGILHAAAARQLRAQELPNAGGQTADVSEVDYLLATRFPPAWNARHAAEVNCSTGKVTLIVPDFYFGSPSAFASQTEGAVTFDGLPLEPLASQVGDSHGYEVVGTLTAKFDALLSHGANPLPSCLQIHTVDASGLDAAQLIDQLAAVIAAEAGPVIVGSSVGYRVSDSGLLCPNGCLDLPDDFAANARQFVAESFLDGIHWASFAMQPSFADRVLIVQAAGNEAALQPGLSYPGFSDARLNSPIAIGSVLANLEAIVNDTTRWAPPGLPSLVLDAGVVQTLKDLRDALMPATPTARNLAIVGSATNQPLLADLQRSSFSNVGADLFAVGEGVSLIDLLVKDGTSYSAPQVAGLASMLWLLDADLRAQPVEQTLALIRATSASNARLGGVIDAYAAVLAIDARRQRLDVRKTLLDVNGDGVFDHLDLAAFMQAYAVEPTGRDYSRFDLNGDGATGGIGIDRFALEPRAVGAPPTGNVTVKIEGYEIDMNQAALSDLQILCYYAYASGAGGAPLLYDSRAEAISERTRILGPDRCVHARLSMQLPAQISVATTMNVNVAVPAAQGQFAPAPDVLVELTSTCATVNPASGRTDANGAISTVVTPSAGCTTAQVQAVARADVGTAPLAQQVVSTAVAGPAQSTFAAVSIDQASGVAGELRAGFAVLDAAGSIVNQMQFTAPVSNLANFMARVETTLAGGTEIGSLSISLRDPGLAPIRLDLPGVPVGQLGITVTCGSNVSLTVGDVVPNPSNPFSQGTIGIGGCGTVTVKAGKAVSVAVAPASSLDATVTAGDISNGIFAGQNSVVTSSRLAFTVGTTRFLSINNTTDSTISIQGSVSGGLGLFNNQNLILGSTLDSPGLSFDLSVDRNSFAGPSLSRLQVGSMRNLTLTNNVGFSNADAQAFATGHSVTGTTTIVNNRAN